MRRIRAGLPSNWEAGDKTGSGDYGTTNDVALIWPPNRAPISLAIYYTQDKEDAKWKDEAILSATKIVMNALQ
jgi:beta-lactamase class A